MTVASLTRTEAEERAALLAVSRYDIEVDLAGLLEGEVWEATSSVQFSCGRPGAATFVDAVGEIVSATLNGQALDPAAAADGRLPLGDLQAENTLVLTLRQTDVTSSAGILRTVDPSDGNVYVWTSLGVRRRAPSLGLLRPARPQGSAPLRGERSRVVDRAVQHATRDRRRAGGWLAHLGVPGHSPAVAVRHRRQRRSVPRGA